MSARHRQAKKRAAELVDLGNRAATNLAMSLATAGALCAAFWDGFGVGARSDSDDDDEHWEPGCGRDARGVGAGKDGGG